MAKFIQEFYGFLSFIEGKDIASERPPEEIDQAVYLVIVDEFNKWLDHYVKTKKVSAILENFKRRKDISLTAGKGTLPPDYAIWRVLYKDDGKTRIDVVEDLYWNDRATRSLGKISETRPIARIDFSKDVAPVKQLEVLPSTLTVCELLYFKAPAHPKYAYTIEGTRYVYDDVNSVDIEFSLLNYPNLVISVSQLIGIHIRENQLFQYMQVLKSEEQRK